MRNFSKFHAMSVLLIGFHMRNLESSLGCGRFFFSHLNTGCSFSPLASTLSIMMALGSNPFPGLTCRREFMISSPFEFSW